MKKHKQIEVLLKVLGEAHFGLHLLTTVPPKKGRRLNRVVNKVLVEGSIKNLRSIIRKLKVTK